MAQTKTDIFGSETRGQGAKKLWWWLLGYRPVGLVNRAPDVEPGRKLKYGTGYFWERWEKS
jgi:hypothetical protein